jgi:hypothetical protein
VTAGLLRPLAGGIALSLSNRASVLGSLSFSVMTPTIQAVGKGSSSCQWHFEKYDRPLLGDQTMTQTVLVHRGTRFLELEMRAHAMIRPRFLSFSSRHETHWVKVSCPLVGRV